MSFSIGQMNQLANALEKAGFTPDYLTKLGQCKKLASIKNVLDGYAEIVRVKPTSDNFLSRTASVNRMRTPQEALDATGRRLYINVDVVATMPKSKGEKMEVIFFKPDRRVTDNELEKEYELRGLTACDPYTLAAVNEANLAFADEYPNATHWKDANGKWCFAIFPRNDGERDVLVGRRDDNWSSCSWWFAGVRPK